MAGGGRASLALQSLLRQAWRGALKSSGHRGSGRGSARHDVGATRLGEAPARTRCIREGKAGASGSISSRANRSKSPGPTAPTSTVLTPGCMATLPHGPTGGRRAPACRRGRHRRERVAAETARAGAQSTIAVKRSRRLYTAALEDLRHAARLFVVEGDLTTCSRSITTSRA